MLRKHILAAHTKIYEKNINSLDMQCCIQYTRLSNNRIVNSNKGKICELSLPYVPIGKFKPVDEDWQFIFKPYHVADILKFWLMLAASGSC